MVNLIRNYILCKRMPDTETPAPWERWMPLDFVGKQLPQYLINVRRALISAREDWWDLTYRVEELLSVVFNNRFRGFAEQFDSRITQPAQLPGRFLYSNILEPLNEEAHLAQGAALLTYPEDTFLYIPIQRIWHITSLAGGLVGITTLKPQSEGGRTKTASLGSNGTLLALDLGFTVDLATLPIGALWRATSHTHPNNGLVQVVSDLHNLRAEDLNRLFTDETDALKLYKQWFRTGSFAQDIIAGAVLAYVTKVDQL